MYVCGKIAKLAYLADYVRSCLTNLDQIFSFDRHVSGDDYSDICVEIDRSRDVAMVTN